MSRLYSLAPRRNKTGEPLVHYAFGITKEKMPKRGEGFLTTPCAQSALACSVWRE